MRLIAPGPPKLCPECGFMRPRRDFYAHRHPNGSVYASYLCVEHTKARVIERDRRNRSEVLERNRRYRERVMADPEAHAFRKDYQREFMRRKLGITPDRYRVNRPKFADHIRKELITP